MDGASTKALIRDVQFHPVSDAPEHVDFQRLAAGEQIRVAVPVHFENEGLSSGLKRGGVLNVIRHAVEVYCDPDHIPEHFTADLSGLDFNASVRWSDLKGIEGTRPVITGRDFVVATVAPPTKMTEATAETPAAVAAAPVAAGGTGGGAGGKGPGCQGARRQGRRPRQGQAGLIPAAEASCSSGSGSAIRSRAWPGTGTISASWRSM